MKFIQLLTALIAAFTVNCRDLPDGVEDEISTNEAHQFPGISTDPYITDKDQYITNLQDGTKADISTNEAKHFPGGPMETDNTDEDKNFPNRPMNPLTFGKKQLITSGGEPEGQHTSDINHQIHEEGMGQRGIKLRGKATKCGADIVCSLLGGDCVSNEIYCTGREVESVCNGTNCKCCIPVSLSVKMHVVEVKLQNIESKLDSLLTANSKLDSIINSNSNITISNSNMDLKMDTLISSSSNLTQGNLEMKSELQIIKENMTNANANQDVILDSIKERQGCPEEPKGLFLFAPTNQCFLMLNDTTRNWDTAKAFCQSKKLELAQPYDLISIRNYVVTKYGIERYMWIGARGDGSNMRWLRNKKSIGSNNPLWYSRSVSTSSCLMMMTYENFWKSYGNKVLHSTSCSSGYYALCELVRE